tara:strand:- start:29985 stop:31115 length:1131 start_codon:yes stop_codon:yes gene_type:complete
MDGQLEVISDNGTATAFEITFTGKSVDLSPRLEQHKTGDVKMSITARDSLLPFALMQLEKAFVYLQCYFEIEILIDDVDIKYEGETEAEEKEIQVKAFSTKREPPPLRLTYDYLTRALMAAESGEAPEFEATLLNAARSAMLRKRYIDSFRYSFLLIESLYGEGKFKKNQLKEALNSSSEFRSIVIKTLDEPMSPRKHQTSDTERLLSGSPSVEEVIEHLVDKRGFYFHGNVKRSDAWQPHEQTAAEALCLLSIQIAMSISHQAAAAMFDDALSQRHYDEAKQAGAIMTMVVKYQFRDSHENFDRDGRMNVNVPGTKVTPAMAAYVAKNFLQRLEETLPDAELKVASCVVDGTDQKVFDIQFHVNSDSEKCADDDS